MTYSDCKVIPRKGVFNLEKNIFIEHSLLKRSRYGVEHIVSDVSSAIEIEATNMIEKGYYAGIKVNHFGHYLLESMSRRAK